MAKSLIDFILPEDYDRYNELLGMAEEAKKNAPKAPRAKRAPMTTEQKKKMSEGRLAKAQAALDALLAAQSNG